MTFDGIITKNIVEELQNIENYKIDKIYQPDKNTIILGAYGNGTNIAILICISSNNYRIHLTTHTYKNPKTAMNYCMFLRKHILGYKIRKIYNIGLERIIYIELENDENPEKPIHKKLIVELMGKHSNVILTDENEIIIDSLRHTSTEENAQRDIYPTARYVLPKASTKEWKHEEEPAINNAVNEAINKGEIYGLNFAIDDFYYNKEQKEKFTNQRNQILNVILDTLKKYERRLKNMDDKLTECEGKEKNKLYGELITAHLYKMPKYNIESIEVENYYDNNKIIQIPLDKRYSPSINAKRYFKKYTKLKNALEIVNIQKKETVEDIKYLESIIYEIETCQNMEDIEEIYNEIYENEIFQNGKNKGKHKIKNGNGKSGASVSNKKIKSKKMTKNKFASFNPLKYNIDGYIIYVGRNNKENDYLTNKFASKNDIWFHTKDIHGSHVIIKNNTNEEIPQDILYEAAKLAVEHSKAKNSTNVPVDYCLVKFVKKIPGNKPGLVTYSNNKTIYV